MIHYRYHPYYERTVTVVNRMICSGERVSAVIYPDGQLRKIPAWMLEPQAEQRALHDPPRISIGSLHELRHVLAVILSLHEQTDQSKSPKGDAP